LNNTFTFVIIDDDQANCLKTRAVAESFQNFVCLGVAHNYSDGIDCILEKNPSFIFLEINPTDLSSQLSLGFINEMYRYLTIVPKIIITSSDDKMAFDAVKQGVYDYLIKPVEQKDFRKTIARLNRDANVVQPIVSTSLNEENKKPVDFYKNELEEQEEVSSELDFNPDEENSKQEELEKVIKLDNPSELLNDVVFTNDSKDKPLTICVKSYGDYRYINANDVCFLQADNNSTDMHLVSGEIITAFKTLKHFEAALKYPFVRIHNSYIVNTNFVSRIHTGNAVCHIKDTTTKLPFSKSYKENVDAIINTIASGNYLEI
jgi:DNA-binding LytR/AlgR family response regulator